MKVSISEALALLPQIRDPKAHASAEHRIQEAQKREAKTHHSSEVKLDQSWLKDVDPKVIALLKKAHSGESNYVGPAAVAIGQALTASAAKTPFTLHVTKTDDDKVQVMLLQRAGMVRLKDHAKDDLAAVGVNVPGLRDPQLSSQQMDRLEALEHPELFAPAASASASIDLGTPDGKRAYEKLNDPGFHKQLVELEQRGVSFAEAFALLLQPTTSWNGLPSR
jgi:hypothetical protein